MSVSLLRAYPSIKLCVEALRTAGYEPVSEQAGRVIPRVWQCAKPPEGNPVKVRLRVGIHAYPHRVVVVPADGGPTGGMAA